MSEQEIQISFVLKGRDAAAFLSYKSNSFLSANAETARQLVLQRLAQIHHEARPASAGRKQSVRSRQIESESGASIDSEGQIEKIEQAA